MPTHSFVCSREECGHVFSELLKTTEDRGLPRTCPECGEETGGYSFKETMARARVPVQMDDIHAMESKFGGNPHWKGVSNTYGTRAMRGKGSPGAGRHLAMDPNKGSKFKGTKVDVPKRAK